MKHIIWTMLFMGITTFAFTQEEKILPVAQEMPTLQACADLKTIPERRKCTDEKIAASLAENLEYPEAAKQAGVDGFVIVHFVVDEKGRTSDLTIESDPGYGMGEAALKAVKKIGKWNPGKNLGQPVKVRMTVPVSFTIPEKEVTDPVRTPDVYVVADKMPEFQGCDLEDVGEARNCTLRETTKYLRENLVYPEEAKKSNITGIVVVKFVVNETGAVTDAKIDKGIGGGCDEEALRLVKAMPAWVPGMQNGKAVKVQMTIPIQFLQTVKE